MSWSLVGGDEQAHDVGGRGARRQQRQTSRPVELAALGLAGDGADTGPDEGHARAGGEGFARNGDADLAGALVVGDDREGHGPPPPIGCDSGARLRHSRKRGNHALLARRVLPTPHVSRNSPPRRVALHAARRWRRPCGARLPGEAALRRPSDQSGPTSTLWPRRSSSLMVALRQPALHHQHAGTRRARPERQREVLDVPGRRVDRLLQVHLGLGARLLAWRRKNWQLHWSCWSPPGVPQLM